MKEFKRNRSFFLKKSTKRGQEYWELFAKDGKELVKIIDFYTKRFKRTHFNRKIKNVV